MFLTPSCSNNNYLVTAKGMDNNCVEQCPKNTITNNSTWECEDGNDNMDDKVVELVNALYDSFLAKDNDDDNVDGGDVNE